MRLIGPTRFETHYAMTAGPPHSSAIQGTVHISSIE